MRIRLSCIFAALAVACALLATGQASAGLVDELGSSTVPAPEKIQEIEDAVARFKERDFDGALKLLEAAVKKNADLPPAQIILAQLFASANIPGGVRNAIERAVLNSPNDPEAYVILGDFAIRDGRVTEADMLYAKAKTLLETFKSSPKRKDLLQPRILNGLAQVAEARDDWPTAKKLLEDWLKIDPKNANTLQRLGRVLFMQKDATTALEMLKRAKDLDATVLTPEARLAQFWAATAETDPKAAAEAKKNILLALKNAPKDLRTCLVAGQYYLENNQVDLAKEQAAAALQIDPKSIEAKILRGVIALFQRDFKEAELYFESAALQSPSNFAASNNLALALVEQSDEAKKRRALEYATKNAQLYQKSAEAASTYGWVLYKLGRLDDAEQALRAAVSSGNVSADTAFYIARVAADKGRKDEAKTFLKAALDSKRPFSQREEAEKLMGKLGGASTGTGTGTGTNPK